MISHPADKAIVKNKLMMGYFSGCEKNQILPMPVFRDLIKNEVFLIKDKGLLDSQIEAVRDMLIQAKKDGQTKFQMHSLMIDDKSMSDYRVNCILSCL